MKLFLTIILVTAAACAQQPAGPAQIPSPPEEGQFIFFEILTLPTADSVSCRIDIPYRIDRQFFVAVRSEDKSFPYPFVRRGEVYLDLLDSKGTSKARDIHRFEIGEQTGETPPEQKLWREGLASFTLPPGQYTLVLEVVDLESQRRFFNRNKTIEAKLPAGEGLHAGPLMFIEPPNQDSTVIRLVNLGGNMFFGGRGFLFMPLSSRHMTADPFRVIYTISTQPFFQRDAKQVQSDTLDLAPLTAPYPVRGGDFASPTYRLEPSPVPTFGGLIIPLAMERLPLRPFSLAVQIEQGSLKSTLTHSFTMIWPDMPASLRDIDLALDALRHITRPEELDSLKSGSRDTRLRNLENFWRAKDRTPDTEFNEVMAEYYRRVDYTLRTFSSIRGGDGFRTDRGRIYILHGPPTSTERRLDVNGGTLEIWVYERQARRYVFADQSKSGIFTLVATQNL